MITEEQKKAIFVCWMTDTEKSRERNVGSLIQYLSDHNLINMTELPQFLSQKSEIIEADRKACEEIEKKKTPFTQELCDIILKALATAPDSQLASHLKEKSIKFRDSNPSLQEAWKYIIEMSEEPDGSNISSFLRELCEIQLFYKEPV